MRTQLILPNNFGHIEVLLHSCLQYLKEGIAIVKSAAY